MVGIGKEREQQLSQKKFTIIPLATALASLGTAGNAAVPSQTNITAPTIAPTAGEATSKDKANAFFQVGHDLLGMIVTEREDGTLFAGHSSHSSHASHSSHSSSRY